MTPKKISFVVPVFNESPNITPLYQELSAVMSNVKHAFEIIFVDDGSTDDSVAAIHGLGSRDRRVFCIELSRNFGQQYALKAGMDIAKGDCVISMDCDLQHPSDVVLQLIQKWEEGYDVVYTKRLPDKTLPWLKRKTSDMFYKVLNILSDTKLESGVADFRLLSRNVVQAIIGLKESGMFLRGLVKWVGFKQARIDYHAHNRHSGVSKYTFKKMVAFALQGVLSFSTRPLFFILYTGLFLLIISLAVLAWIVIDWVTTGEPNWFAVVLDVLLLFFSTQLVMIGIISVYMSRLVAESRNRPLYIVRSTNYV
jgi:glycosyltransferase involved in cell wall biosynthesis